MRYISTTRLSPGMILGKDLEVQLPNGLIQKLFRKGATLTQPIIDRLAEKDIRGLYIQDDITDDIVIEETIPLSLQQKTLQSFRTKDVEELVKSAKEIAEEIFRNKNVNVDLLRMINSHGYDKNGNRLMNYEEHSLNVLELAIALAKVDPEFNYGQLLELSSAALLHDIGKIVEPSIKSKYNIPEELYKRADQLGIDKDTFDHPIVSFIFLKSFHTVSAVTNKAILCHHEQPNGLGYPSGMKEKDIPVISSIINICDRYELYLEKNGNPIEARLLLLEDYKNGVVDTRLTELFVRYIPIFPISSTVVLSTGEEAVVVDNNRGFPERPIIRLVSDPLKTNIDLTKELSTTIIGLCIGGTIVRLENKDSNLKR